jgi:ABC-2 type transport system ATP-binding protein
MSEMEQTADRLVVIGRGRLIADATTESIMRGLGHRLVRVRTPEPDEFLTCLSDRGFAVTRVDTDELRVEDTSAEEVGRLAHALHLPLYHLSEVEQSL